VSDQTGGLPPVQPYGQPSEPLPDPNETPTISPSAAVRPRVGVGFGERAKQSVQESGDQREYGQPRAVVTIRYTKPE